MAAPAPTTLDIIKDALQDICAMGAGEAAPSAEDTALGLRKFNNLSEQLNLRARNCGFMRQQSWAFAVSQETYSIGATADSPDFAVTSGVRPTKIAFAHLVLTGSYQDQELNMAVINVDQFTKISIPKLSSNFPLVMYYQPTNPNGTIRPYPSYPTATSYELKLWWPDQLGTVDIADISTDLVLAQGYRKALTSRLALELYPNFAKRTDLDELKRQDRENWSDIGGLNQPPPKISSTDGIQSWGSTYDWRSGLWQ